MSRLDDVKAKFDGNPMLVTLDDVRWLLGQADAVAALTAENAAYAKAIQSMKPYMLRFTDGPYTNNQGGCFFCDHSKYGPHAEYCTWANIKRTWLAAAGAVVSETAREDPR